MFLFDGVEYTDNREITLNRRFNHETKVKFTTINNGVFSGMSMVKSKGRD